MTQDTKAETLLPSEAVYAFAAWLTTRNQRVTFSGADDASAAAELVAEFIKSQCLENPREDYHLKLKPYQVEPVAAVQQGVQPFGYVNTYTGQFFADVEPCRKNNEGHWRTVYAAHPTQQGLEPVKLLAKDHASMRVDYSGLLGKVQREMKRSAPGYAEMIRQLQGHLQELGQRWYAGQTEVVDEILQLYCIESEARKALAAQAKQGGV